MVSKRETYKALGRTHWPKSERLHLDKGLEVLETQIRTFKVAYENVTLDYDRYDGSAELRGWEPMTSDEIEMAEAARIAQEDKRAAAAAKRKANAAEKKRKAEIEEKETLIKLVEKHKNLAKELVRDDH